MMIMGQNPSNHKLSIYTNRASKRSGVQVRNTCFLYSGKNGNLLITRYSTTLIGDKVPPTAPCDSTEVAYAWCFYPKISWSLSRSPSWSVGLSIPDEGTGVARSIGMCTLCTCSLRWELRKEYGVYCTPGQAYNNAVPGQHSLYSVGCQ